jgi:murein DD-endopeptidase MepM/ murein hydrolase activator NlpD
MAKLLKNKKVFSGIQLNYSEPINDQLDDIFNEIVEEDNEWITNIPLDSKLCGSKSQVEESLGKLTLNIIEKPPVWPFRVTSPFGKIRNLPHYSTPKVHAGIDLVKWDGKNSLTCDIQSGVNGVVVFAKMEGEDPENRKWGCRGNCVTIQSTKDKNVFMGYYHLEKIYVKEGDVVTPITKIGYMGNTGCSYGAHLHFEVNVGQGKYSMIRGLPYPNIKVDPDLYYIGDFNLQSKVVNITKMPILKVGNKGVDVEFLQSLLQQNYIQVKKDGIFGPCTEKSVIEFQTKEGLMDDGIVGSNTWIKLTT